jgi:hypothetical protein
MIDDEHVAQRVRHSLFKNLDPSPRGAEKTRVALAAVSVRLVSAA